MDFSLCGVRKHQADDDEIDNLKRAAVTHVRKRNAGNGHDADDHSDILEDVNENHRGETDDHRSPEDAVIFSRDGEKSPQEKRVEEDEKRAADKAEFFSENGEDIVVLFEGDEIVLRLCAFEKTAALKLSAADGKGTLIELPTDTGDVRLGIQEDANTVFLIVGEEEPCKRQRNQSETQRIEKVSDAQTRRIEHQDDEKDIDHRRAEVGLQSDEHDREETDDQSL